MNGVDDGGVVLDGVVLDGVVLDGVKIILQSFSVHWNSKYKDTQTKT